jgi:diadenosine tetraphosphate (Ap4A) HIT family hydrolase
MPSIFTRIVNGEIPSHKIAETEDFFAFFDVFPCAPGHTLVIPKKEVDYIFDLDDALYEGLMKFSKYGSRRCRKSHSLQAHRHSRSRVWKYLMLTST